MEICNKVDDLVPSKRHIVLLLVTGFVLCSFGVMWGLPNLYDFAQDSITPVGTFAEKGFDFDRITTHRYPPFHFMLLRAAFLPVHALRTIPALGENMKLSATLFILAARFVSLAMALGTMLLLYAIGKRLWDERASLAAALIFILSPVTLYYAKNANLDVPYVFWLAATLFFYVRILQENRPGDYLWLGLVAALAICTKDQAYGFLLFMPLPIIHRLWMRPEGEDSGRPGRYALLTLAAVAFALPFILIHNVLFDPSGFWRHVKMIVGPGSEGWREFSAGAMGQLHLLCETVLRVMGAWTPAGLALVVIGLVVTLKRKGERRGRLALLVPVISYHVSFLAVVGYVYPRFVLPMMLVLALFAGAAVAWLWQRKWGKVPGAAVAIALMAWVGLAGLSVDYVMATYSRYDAQMWLEQKVPGEARVSYLGDMRDMPRFNKPLDPHPCEPNAEVLAESRADVLVLSFERGHPEIESDSVRLASIISRNLGEWGRVKNAQGMAHDNRFFERLLGGEMGYVVHKRFESRIARFVIARFVPKVAESVNRTIVIMIKSKPQMNTDEHR